MFERDIPRGIVTVRHTLQLSTVQSGRPIVQTGDIGLENQVRWVHVSELPDIGKMLHGGELLLTTGIAHPDTNGGLAAYVEDLRAAGVAGLIIELGRRYQLLPPPLVEAMQRAQIPLIALQEETPFVKITEEVHELILAEQLNRLRLSDQIHRAFTDMSMHGANAQDIVSHVARLAGGAVVLENLVHQILAYETHDEPIESVIGDWERGARRLLNKESTEVIAVGPDTWIVTDVAARGQKWGRLMMRIQGSPTPTQIEVIERGATALAINRLVDRTRETLERQAQRTLLNDIRTGSYSSPAVVDMHGQNLGVPLLGRTLVGVVVSVSAEESDGFFANPSQDHDATEIVTEAIHSAEVPALVGVLRSGQIGVLLSLPPGGDVDGSLSEFSKEVHRAVFQTTPPPKTRIGVGAVVDNLRDLQRSFVEAEQIVAASAGMPDDRLYFALSDIRLRGLLYLLKDDPRLQLFIERELAALLMHDDANDSDLEHVLRVFLSNGANKSSAATELNLSRPSLYYRLEQLESILGVSLDDIESAVSLHVALVALDVVRLTDD
jgi:PucR family transcriptional regulator, purine catabolism regulatory protein